MKNQAAIQLSNSVELRKLCNARVTNGMDLVQDVIVVLLELPDEKVKQIIDGGYLEFWAIRTACNIATKTNRRNKYYSDKDIEKLNQNNSINIYDQLDARHDLKQVNEKLDQMYWYDKKLLEIYIEEGSYRKAQEATGIPYKSIMTTIKRIRAKLIKL